MKLFLGVDGGQSSTTALIGDERGRILGRGTGGPCNHAAAAEGRARLRTAVWGSLSAACREAGLEPGSVGFTAACFGMSGGPDDKHEILASVLRAGRLIVTHDAAIALSGATAAGQGIAVIAGTGSIAFARNAAGRTARAGGWGYVFGDEGGAFDIVRQALRAALRMEEGWGPPTALRQVLLDAAASTSVNQLLHLWYGSEWPRSRVAVLAPLVDAAAAEGDAVAQRVMGNAAQELALLAASARPALWHQGEAVDVAYIGGVFRSPRVLEHFRLLVELEAGNRCCPPQHGPAEGALLEALRSSGLNPELR
jgi:N-acetylglucosamine kinase-like BadF-type ATPase